MTGHALGICSAAAAAARYIRASLAILLLVCLPDRVAAQFPPDSFTNLKALPRDIGQRELIDLMAGFTRALGVRCTYCHVGEEGEPLGSYDFVSDEKSTKLKARAMIEMVRRINEEDLAALPDRAEPRLQVRCMTCHRGVTEPRTLQDLLLQAYAGGGLASTLAVYDSLRREYYGSAAYDFGEVPLVDVANIIRRDGALGDGVRLHELNVQMNPTSGFAKWQHAVSALLLAFSEGEAAGSARYAALRDAYGQETFSPFVFGQIGAALLQQGLAREAVALHELSIDAHPASSQLHAALGAAQAAAGDIGLAIASYERAIELDPQNADAVQSLRELRARR